MGVFKDNARKLYESGLAVVPCLGKAAIPEWKKWQDELPSENHMSAWEKAYPDANIGVICGPVSGIVVIDIDNAEYLSRLPLSPMAFSSQPGVRESRVFKYSGELTSHYDGVDVLGLGALVIIPPSIHPSGRPYKAISWCDFDDLPTLPSDFANGLRPRTAPEWSSVSGIHQGRWVTLSGLAYAKACSGESVEEIAAALLSHSSSTWFYDKDEPHRGQRPEKEALKMAKAAFDKSVLKGEQVIGGTSVCEVPHPPTLSEDLPPEQSPPDESPRYHYPPLPESGFIRELYDQIMFAADGLVPAIALGTSIATASALISPRFSVKTHRDDLLGLHLFVLLIAPTGIGKTFAQSIPLRLFESLPPSSVYLGAGHYKSAAALLDGLKQNRYRYDIADEVASMIGAMGDGSASQKDIVDQLCALYSSNPEKRFMIGKNMTDKRQGKADSELEVYGPLVTFLGATTNAGLIAASSATLSAKGLLPRFLTFTQPMLDRMDYKPTGTFDSLLDWATWMSEHRAGEIARSHMEIRFKGSISTTDRHIVRCLEFEDETSLRRLSEAHYDETKALASSLTLVEQQMRTRRIETASKLAAILFLSEMPAKEHITSTPIMVSGIGDRHMADVKVPMRYLDKALEIVDWTFNTNMGLMQEMSADTEKQRCIRKVFDAILRNRDDSGMVPQSSITRSTQGMTRQMRTECLNDLIEMGQIREEQAKSSLTSHKLSKCYVLLRDKL